MMRIMRMMMIKRWLLPYYDQICLVTPHGRDRCQQMTSRRTYLPPLAPRHLPSYYKKRGHQKFDKLLSCNFFRFPCHLILLSHVRITRPPGHLGHPAPGNGGQKRQVPDNRWKIISGKNSEYLPQLLILLRGGGGKVPVNRWGVIICVKPTHSPAPPLLNISTAPSSERCNTFGKAHQWTLLTRVIISLPLPGSFLFSA